MRLRKIGPQCFGVGRLGKIVGLLNCQQPWRIALVQVLPNLRPVAAAQFWVTAPAFLLSEANLGLLGLGVAEPVPSWGNLLREMENLSQVARNPWMAAPLVALAIVVGCFQLAISTGDLEA